MNTACLEILLRFVILNDFTLDFEGVFVPKKCILDHPLFTLSVVGKQDRTNSTFAVSPRRLTCGRSPKC